MKQIVVVVAVLVTCTPVVSAEMDKGYGSTSQATATDKMKPGTSQATSSQVTNPSSTTNLPDNGSYDLAKQAKSSTAAHHTKHASTAKHHEAHPRHTASASTKAKHPRPAHTTHTSSAGTH